MLFAEVVGLGYETFYMVENHTNQLDHSNVYQHGVFSNDYFQAEIESNGSITVKEHTSNKVFPHLNIFEESGNAGDEYDFSPPREDVIITTRDSEPEILVVHNGPLFATVKIGHIIKVPVDTDVNKRSKKKESVIIETFVTVKRHEDRIDIKTVIHNTVKNHRIRALFETGVVTNTHKADQQFGVIRRDNLLPQVDYWEKEQWEEKYYPIYPHQKYVDVSDGEKGLSVLNKGLPQYEILDGNTPTIALTLLCGTDYMGKQDLIHRPGRRSGLHVETPDSSLLGRYEMEYSFIPHSGNEAEAEIGLKADEYTASMVAVQINEPSDTQRFSDKNSFFELDHPFMAISAVKKCENDDNVIIRIYNTTDKEIPFVHAQINGKFFKKAELADLNEKPLSGDETADKFQFHKDTMVITNIKENEIINIKLSRV
ncbi:glycoside hydrolase family 38 C-terminal domain-containing protein [Alteribacillus sp. JSM 102045]|uniref:glycoside hydrolase family 38 C-terminal domain-containing protein n=1 Tax=Alteribacillus sp. JSM 102045 TaxID=1562101 RepID=UPI0035C1BEA3